MISRVAARASSSRAHWQRWFGFKDSHSRQMVHQNGAGRRVAALSDVFATAWGHGSAPLGAARWAIGIGHVRLAARLVLLLWRRRSRVPNCAGGYARKNGGHVLAQAIEASRHQGGQIGDGDREVVRLALDSGDRVQDVAHRRL